MDLETRLKEKFNSKNCITELCNCVQNLAKEMGVDIQVSILSADKEKIISPQVIQEEFRNFTVIFGAISAGTKFNPVRAIRRQK